MEPDVALNSFPPIISFVDFIERDQVGLGKRVIFRTLFEDLLKSSYIVEFHDLFFH